ncbi:unnamed protein product [Penicillium egyptiacum]|uniref:Uncharacterized protein n=1 Tax=Penicillium egyptiacum TaxID=1303716 RepID=A0A9W4KAP7_9EURO|nr:unnamed protein product [Penicillium egyptiacum]
MDPHLGTDFAAIAPIMSGRYPPYNSLAHYDESTGKTEVYFLGRTHLMQEPGFIPRASSTEEGDRYLMELINNYRTLSSELRLLSPRPGRSSCFLSDTELVCTGNGLTTTSE